MIIFLNTKSNNFKLKIVFFLLTESEVKTESVYRFNLIIIFHSISILTVNYYGLLWRHAINPSTSLTCSDVRRVYKSYYSTVGGCRPGIASLPSQVCYESLDGSATLFHTEMRPGEIASGEEIRRKSTMESQVWIDVSGTM